MSRTFAAICLFGGKVEEWLKSAEQTSCAHVFRYMNCRLEEQEVCETILCMPFCTLIK